MVAWPWLSLASESDKENPSIKDQKVFEDLIETTAHIRGLDFKEEVTFSRISRDEIPALFEKELSRVYREEDFERIQTCLFYLGAIPENLQIQQMLLAMIGEQVAGLYDPLSKEMKVVGDLSLEVGLVQVILEHELTHALTDQHFDLKSLPIEDIHNDDRALAALSLVEGDATLSMMEYAKNLGVQSSFSAVLISLFMDQQSFYSAPPFYQGWLMFPYLGGEMFLLDLMKSHGVEGDRLMPKERFNGFDWKVVDHLYRHPPVSTEQVLHPEKYTGNPDLPAAPTDRFLATAKSGGWEVVWENTLGEFLIRTLFEQTLRLPEANRAAQGWGGDRYYLLNRGDQEILVWSTVWDTLQESEEFALSCDKMKRRGGFPANTLIHHAEGDLGVLIGISRDLDLNAIETLLKEP